MLERAKILEHVLKEMEAQAKVDPVIVGFSQNYAVYVHENTGATHDTGEAKFLERPLREDQDEIASTVRKFTKKSSNMTTGLLAGGRLLQRKAMKLTPVDTGALRASAFTCKEKDLEEVKLKAFSKGASKRKSSTEKKAKAADKKKQEAAYARTKKRWANK